MLQPSTRKSAAVIVIATLIALATWVLIRLLGVEPAVTSAAGNAPVGAFDVAFAAAGAGVAAWGVSAWLARRGSIRWWPLVGSTALAVSIIGPSWLADGADAVALICLHLVVGLVLIQGFAQSVVAMSSADQVSDLRPVSTCDGTQCGDRLVAR